MEKIPYRVFLKPREGRKTEVRGDTAEALLEAMVLALGKLGADKPEKLIGFDFTLIERSDPTLPENVSLVDAAAMAIALGYKTKKDIADYILRYIESHL